MADLPQPGRVRQASIEGRADHGLADDRSATQKVADHDHSAGDDHGHAHHVSDKAAAFTGLLLGAALIGAILFSVVKLTNAHYANEKPAAGETQK